MTRLPDPKTQADFYADVPIKRLLAWGVDVVITLGLSIVIALLSFGIFFWIFFAVWAVVSFVYRVVTITSGSATLGMRFAGIEFRTRDGLPFDGATALLHTGGTVLTFGFSFLHVISMIMMVTTARGQGLVDMVLGTVAINRRGRM